MFSPSIIPNNFPKLTPFPTHSKTHKNKLQHKNSLHHNIKICYHHKNVRIEYITIPTNGKLLFYVFWLNGAKNIDTTNINKKAICKSKWNGKKKENWRKILVLSVIFLPFLCVCMYLVWRNFPKNWNEWMRNWFKYWLIFF